MKRLEAVLVSHPRGSRFSRVDANSLAVTVSFGLLLPRVFHTIISSRICDG